MSPVKKAEIQKNFDQFLRRAKLSFNNPELLLNAFTHRSYLNESKSGMREHNERLEFLGDAVIELIVTDHLYRMFPKAHEGEPTSYRAALVNAVMLGSIAHKLGMNDCLLLSKGEAKDTGRARSTILANTFEAVLGALYLDQGYAAAEKFVAEFVLSHTDDVIKKGLWKDAKSSYQEHAQSKYGLTPLYKTLSAKGPDHDKQFVVALMVGDVEVARGEGKSKQDAEQAAAVAALADKS